MPIRDLAKPRTLRSVNKKAAASSSNQEPGTDAAPVQPLRHATIQRALVNPHNLAPADVLQLQRVLGNSAISSLLGRNPAQNLSGSRMRVGPADDAYEREAQRVAGQVSGHVSDSIRNSVSIQRSAAPQTLPLAEPEIGLDGGKVSRDLESQIRSAQSGGNSVPHSIRRSVEQRTGMSYRDVRVHEGKNAHDINDALGARAATTGKHIFLGRNQSPHNVQLMAHELTHVAQQTDATDQPVVQRLPMRPQDFQNSFGTPPGGKGKTNQAYLDIITGLTTYYDAYDNLYEKVRAKYSLALERNMNNPSYIAWRSVRLDVLDALRKAQTGTDRVTNRYAKKTGFFALTKGAKRANAAKRQARGVLDQLKAELNTAMGELADRFDEVSPFQNEGKVKTTESLSQKAGAFRDKNLKTVKEKFGKGAVNEVSLLEHEQSGNQYVFKSDTTRTNMKAFSSEGIDVELDKDVGYANRAVAMYKLSQLLADPSRGGDTSFDVIPETQFATHGGFFGHIMKFVKGKAGAKSVEREFGDKDYDSELGGKDDILHHMRQREQTGESLPVDRFRKDTEGRLFVSTHVSTDIDYSNEQVQSGLTALQLIDLISGQVDRHPGNYIIEKLPNGKIRVWGIDNDAAFGKGHKSIYQQVAGSKLVGMPEVLSKAHADSILRIKDDDVRAVIGDLLSDQELNNTLNRLHELQDYIKTNYERIVVKKYGEESFQRIRQRARELELESQVSYVGRSDRMLQEAKEKGEVKFEFSSVKVEQSMPSLDTGSSQQPSGTRRPLRTRNKNRKGLRIPRQMPPLPETPLSIPKQMPPLPSLPDDSQQNGGYYLDLEELMQMDNGRHIEDEDLGFTLI